MPRSHKPRYRRWTWLIRIAIALGVVVLVVLVVVPPTIGQRLWLRIPCRITINGRPAREASVFRSSDGSLLVDLRHAPTHADTEGGGYLVQPYWDRLRGISHDYYKVYGPFALLRDVWPAGVELRPDDPLAPVDPRIAGNADYFSFWGLENDHVEIVGKVLLAPLRL